MCSHKSTLLPSGKARVVQPWYLLHLLMVIILVSPSVPETACFLGHERAFLIGLFPYLYISKSVSTFPFFFLGLSNLILTVCSLLVCDTSIALRDFVQERTGTGFTACSSLPEVSNWLKYCQLQEHNSRFAPCEKKNSGTLLVAFLGDLPAKMVTWPTRVHFLYYSNFFF